MLNFAASRIYVAIAAENKAAPISDLTNITMPLKIVHMTNAAPGSTTIFLSANLEFDWQTIGRRRDSW